jgi:predicted metal-dependent hydrolase
MQQLPLFDRPDPETGVRTVPSPPVAPLLPALPLAPIEFVRTPRARRYILRIRPDGSLRVTVPRWGSKREARDFVARQERWIARERDRVLQEHGCRDWHDGSEIWLRGERARIFTKKSPAGLTITYADRRIVVPGDADIRTVVEADLRRLARAELEPRLRELAALHDLQPGRVSIRNQRSRWGSCARAGNIALNFRLVQMPPEIRDYVLVHELMHLRQQNHSSRFWRLVEQACPTFKDAERWLRIQGKALF